MLASASYRNRTQNSAQNLHMVPYFKVVSRPQYLTKICKNGAKTTEILLANHSKKNHLIRSYREKVITILVELCPKTRNQLPAGFYQLQLHFPNSFLIRIIRNLCPNYKELNEESKNPIITRLWITHRYIRVSKEHTNFVSKS
jgi:hypothetical protein